MRRRRFVTVAGIAGTVGLAGCVANSGGEDGPVGDPPPDKRVDQPPHEPEQPPSPETDEQADWNDHWPGEGMATEPSHPFERLAAPLADRQLGGLPPSSGHSEYAVELITSQDGLDSRVEMGGSPDRLRAVDFDEETVVVVESGYGSSSVSHAWTRVEAVESGLHLHGYHTDPLVRTTDSGPRHSVVVVETAVTAAAIAHASLTVAEDRRVNVDSDEGVVSPDRD